MTASKGDASESGSGESCSSAGKSWSLGRPKYTDPPSVGECTHTTNEWPAKYLPTGDANISSGDAAACISAGLDLLEVDAQLGHGGEAFSGAHHLDVLVE